MLTDESEPESSHPVPLGAFAVTVAASAAFIALGWIPLPGLAPHVARWTSPTVLSLGALGLQPVFLGYVLVELVAAAVPALRPLRHATEGRVRLARAALAIGLLLALAQAYQMLGAVERGRGLLADSLVHRLPIDPRLSFTAGLLFGVVVAVALARLIDVAGVGAGYSVLIAATMLSGLVRSVQFSVQLPEVADYGSAIGLLVIFAACSWAMLRRPPYEGSRARYRLPTPGLEPIHQAVLFSGLALASGMAQAFFWPLVPRDLDVWVERALQLLLTIALCTILSRLFHRPIDEADKSALRRATRASTLWLCGLTGGSWFVDSVLEKANIHVDSLRLVALVAVGMDLSRELIAHARSGSQRVLRAVHRLEDADALSAALGAAGIDSALRGAHHRSLYHFFAPFIPIGVLVAQADFERAEVVALEHQRALSEPAPLPAAPET